MTKQYNTAGTQTGRFRCDRPNQSSRPRVDLAPDNLPLDPGEDDYETDYVFHDVEIMAVTELAMLAVFRHTPAGVWIPRSQTRDGTTVKRPGDVGNLVLTGWICVKTDLVGHEDGCHSYYI